nr:hypothetical protein [Tanacetum cinerariifolium]
MLLWPRGRNLGVCKTTFLRDVVLMRWPLRVTLGRLLPHARGLEFKPRRGDFPSGVKKEWGLSPKAKVRVLHTAQLDVTGNDTFYVTRYDKNGFECGGYNIVWTRPSRIVTRVWPYADYPQMLPTDFLAGINQNDPLSIRANGRNYNERFARVEIGVGTDVLKYQLRKKDSKSLVEEIRLEEGMFVVFTKHRFYRLGLMAFDTDGNQTTITDFVSVTNIKKGSTK